jgi:AraC-like DNA-binding protein
MPITTYLPQGLLKEFVGAIVHIEDMGMGIALQRVYQTIIINTGSNFYTSDLYKNEPAIENLSTIWINGQHERPFALGNPGKTSMYVIGVKPGMLPYFSKVPVAETNGKALDAAYWAEPDIFTLRQQLLACENIQAGLELIDTYFTGKLEGQDLSALPKINYLSKAMPENTVEEICMALGCTRKKLRADAIYYFGAPVKNMQGIIRFGEHLTAISNASHQSLSSLHTFYDQAHFINDFKARTGMTPSQYRMLCQHYPEIRHTPNFISLSKETFLQFIAKYPA